MSTTTPGSSEPRRARHFVDTAPFDPMRDEVLTPEQERYYMASQWKMMWWKLK
ncbi:MAG: ABC transporter permease, partial [Alphaproteobacteria bacterium]|nr:ABC transporter permease [Alphaproteobacteria bacterium]